MACLQDNPRLFAPARGARHVGRNQGTADSGQGWTSEPGGWTYELMPDLVGSGLKGTPRAGDLPPPGSIWASRTSWMSWLSPQGGCSRPCFLLSGLTTWTAACLHRALQMRHCCCCWYFRYLRILRQLGENTGLSNRVSSASRSPVLAFKQGLFLWRVRELRCERRPHLAPAETAIARASV